MGYMRIVIDARMLYWTGVGRYTKALLDQLARLDHENEYVVLTRPADRGLWEPAVGAVNFRRVEVDINPYTLSEQLRLPGVIESLRPDVVHFTTANGPVTYRGAQVVTVHDLTLLDYDTSRGSAWKRLAYRLKRPVFRWIVQRKVAAAQAVIVPTQYVKDELGRRFGVAAERVTVTWEAADKNLAAPEPVERLGVGRQFLFNVGNVYPYKNMGLALEALKILTPKYPELRLVSTARPDEFRAQLETRARELGVADRVVWTGFVSDGELVTLYREAAAYVYPSLSEGFGLQVLESMVQGLPVVAARASCLPEIGGEAALYFDPRNAAEMAARVAEVLDDEGLRTRLRAAGLEQAKLFSWEKLARTTLAVYERAAK